MAANFDFEAELRPGLGTGHCRRLRRANKVPAVIYGGGAAPVSIALDHNHVLKRLENEAVYSHVLTIHVDGKSEKAVLKGLQRHPSKPVVTHMDFQRVSGSEKIRVNVPLHFINENISVGVKKGGVVTHNLVNVEVVCPTDRLPEYINVDLAQVDVGQSVHLSDLVLPEGVEIQALLHGAEHDIPVAVIQAPRSAEEAIEEAPAE